MKNKKNKICSVFMLPSEKESDIVLIGIWGRIGISDVTKDLLASDESFQHLYFTSHDEINKGDFFIDKSDNKVKQSKGYGVAIGVDLKVVASTDKSITPYCMIPQSFKTLYVENYNIMKRIRAVELKTINLGNGTNPNDDTGVDMTNAVFIHHDKTVQIEKTFADDKEGDMAFSIPSADKNFLEEIGLKKLADILEKAGLRKHTCINGSGYSQVERNIVEALQNDVIESRDYYKDNYEHYKALWQQGCIIITEMQKQIEELEKKQLIK